jgi:hypothetical protein
VGTQDFGSMDPNASLKQVIDALADLMDTLNFLLNGNLDVKNIRAQSITADRMNVKQLSAIAADLGTITAGIIYGAYIATSNGTYPRIEFSSVNKLLTAFSDALNSVDISTNSGGAPGLTWTVDGDPAAYLQTASFGTLLTTFLGDITLQPFDDLNFNLTGSRRLTVNGNVGQNASISYTKNIISDGMGGYIPVNGTMTFTKGILTGWT